MRITDEYNGSLQLVITAALTEGKVKPKVTSACCLWPLSYIPSCILGTL